MDDEIVKLVQELAPGLTDEQIHVMDPVQLLSHVEDALDVLTELKHKIISTGHIPDNKTLTNMVVVEDIIRMSHVCAPSESAPFAFLEDPGNTKGHALPYPSMEETEASILHSILPEAQ
ncbi:hypothetical protein J8273_6422 [Carpediemonas membranifera]|uniref:Uncharacterized protein n=1 Tax=Carpediemonas membranifera TaxID=201153 RepID=A0A8J6E2A1_9EUKA|nr:hypothetical protein J8273_6422 [Carpediemonas membranifera]|eukprot:KAG9391657.1 hypothetical protein J8273_6422 [Carpediemonas membranifera]